jgi:hypothetical protein
MPPPGIADITLADRYEPETRNPKPDRLTGILFSRMLFTVEHEGDGR